MFSSFMLNAWIVGTIIAAAAGMIGFFVVIRGDSFAAHALPLGAFPGAAAAGLFGLNPIIGLVVFASLGVFGIGWLGRRERPEVATALCLVMLLGLGALCLSLSGRYAAGVYALLFGEVLGIAPNVIAPCAIIAGIAIGAMIILFRPLMLSAVAPDLAKARGISPARAERAFLVILALTTAMALPVIGALLVFSLMTGPAAAARGLTTRPEFAMLLSGAIAVVTIWVAIALSYVTNWPVGFFLGCLGAVCYVTGRLAGAVRL